MFFWRGLKASIIVLFFVTHFSFCHSFLDILNNTKYAQYKYDEYMVVKIIYHNLTQYVCQGGNVQ